MRVCDLIAKFINESIGIDDIFMVSGGGVMFLTDGLSLNKNINKICTHHEQAAGMAAVAYAKYKGAGCAYVTTGCGGTNAVTAVLHAWQDNTPVFFISGQCKRKETTRNLDVPIRQLGVQEADIIKIVESITKYSVMINDEKDVLYHLEKAKYLALSGRPGPVWLDIPMDVSAKEIDLNTLKHFDSEELREDIKTICLDSELKKLVDAFKKAKRPIIIAGQGIRLSGAIDIFEKLIRKHNIPFVCSRLGTDVLPTEDPLNIGRIGNKGTRPANLAVQNADLIVSMGSRLSVSSTGQEYDYFGREAKIIAIDIDYYEHRKHTIRIDTIINADLKNVLNSLKMPLDLSFNNWAKKCFEWKQKYPVFLQEYKNTDKGINLYLFIEELSKYLKKDSVLVTDAGSAVYVPAQGIHTTSKEQRYITSGAQAEMGFTLPGTVGVCVARKKKEVIGITGDGSFQMNIQELQTIVHNKLPIKIFVWNNDGYLSIRATQRKFFGGRFLGTDNTCGVSFPELKKIANAYGIKYYKADTFENIDYAISNTMKEEEAVICEVICERDQLIQPTVTSQKLPNGKLVSKPIEDMYPFLPRDEFYGEMVIKPISEG